MVLAGVLLAPFGEGARYELLDELLQHNMAAVHARVAKTSVSGSDCKISPKTVDVRAWVHFAATLDRVDSVCPNYGEDFGWHGARLCPARMANVKSSFIYNPARAASGGVSGATVMSTPDYVVKVIKFEEVELVHKLRRRLRAHGKDALSFIVPVCRVVEVGGKERRAMIIMPNIMIPRENVRHFVFDLKGNWAWMKREAGAQDRTQKDKKFKELFPKGVTLTKAWFMEAFFKADKGLTFIRTLQQDTSTLSAEKLMDYSLLIDMVDDCPRSLVVTKPRANYEVMDGGGELKLTEFHKTEEPFRGNRPVYMNSDKEYLYYVPDVQQWEVSSTGPDDLGRAMFATSEAGCPHEVEAWWAWRPQHEHLDFGKAITAVEPAQALWTTLSQAAQAGDTVLMVTSQEGFSVGDRVVISGGGNSETHTIASFGSIVLTELLQHSYPAGSTVAEATEQENPYKPLLWVRLDDGARFVVSIGIIDALMHEDKRGVGNAVGAKAVAVAQSRSVKPSCTPQDVDPIAALPYQVRFMRMFGYKDLAQGACLKNDRFQDEYTYFRTDLQREQHAEGFLDWGP